MRRAGDLIGAVAAPDNLRLAFLAACRGKRGKREVRRFAADVDGELERLGEALLAGAVAWGPYHEFKVHDPKPRTIHAPRFHSRVAQHAIMNVCAPVFERYQLPESCASRPGKGTDDALARACRACRSGHWFLQMDVRRYFDSIDHATLRGLLRRRFKDRVVLGLFDSILDTFSVAPGKGVPIGNLTSQFFANHYLAFLDHDIKERLRLHGYVRYMDDMLLFGDSGEELRNVCSEIERFCSDELALELKPPIISRTSAGAPFLGFLVKPKGVYLTRKKRRRTKRRLGEFAHKYLNGDWNESELADHILPVCAHLALARSRWIRNTLIERAGLGHEPGSSRR